MTAQDDEKHYEQEETHAKTGNSKWTADAIRALGAIDRPPDARRHLRVQRVVIPEDGANR